MLVIKTWLETTGLKVAEQRFVKPPPLPYIIFLENIDVSGADNKNCIANRGIGIELYTAKVDHISEKLIEDLLNAKVINYTKDGTWLDTEMMFETMYDFNFIEKF